MKTVINAARLGELLSQAEDHYKMFKPLVDKKEIKRLAMSDVENVYEVDHKSVIDAQHFAKDNGLPNVGTGEGFKANEKLKCFGLDQDQKDELASKIDVILMEMLGIEESDKEDPCYISVIEKRNAFVEAI